MPKHDENSAILKEKHGGAIALQGVRARARLQGLLAEVSVEQQYLNPQNTNIEAVYTFPLPFGAVLLGLEVEIAGKELTGQVVEKKEAERRYEDAVTDGDSAVMLEEAGPGLYTASLGNLMAGETAVIRYRYGLLLNWQGDRLRFLFPTTIAPRYGDAAAAGLQPHQVPVSDLSAEYPLELIVDVDGELAMAAIASPSHAIASERTATGLRVRLDRKACLDRDFILTLSSATNPSSCAVVPDGEGCVALASLRIPPLPETGCRPLALKLVIDCSGSMAGTSITQARKAALAILDQLRPGDSFNVTLFGSNYKHFFRTMVPASARYISEAWGMIERMDADMGGTEMEAALSAVFTLKSQDEGGTILLITDGEIHAHEKLVRHAEKAGQRVFVVGVGHAVAETFLRKLAEATDGACVLVAPQEGMGEFVLNQFHRMRQKRLGALRLEWPANPDWQTALPDTLFAGDTLHVFAGFSRQPAGAARLIIEGGGEVAVELTALEDREIPRIAAANRLKAVDETEARRLALDYQLLSRWTNFLVIAERADKAEALPVLHQVPQMLAADWGGTGVAMVCGGGFASSNSAAGLPRHSRAQPMCDTGMDKHDIPAFLCKFADDDVDSSSPPVQLNNIVRSRKKVTGWTDRVMDKLASVAPGLQKISRSERLSVPVAPEDVPGTPMAFIVAMEGGLSPELRDPVLPGQLLDLARWGLADEIVRSLEALVSAGYDEAEVVAAFVFALTQSPIGARVERSYKRAILKCWKNVVPGRELDRMMQVALQEVTADAWHWRESPIDLPDRIPAVEID